MPVISYSDYKEYQTVGNFMRLNQGENRVRLVSKPYAFQRVFDEARGPQRRFGWTVIDRADNEVKLLEVGPQIFGQVSALAMDSEYGDPSKYDIKIFRTGEGLETDYKVIPTPTKSELTAEEKKKVGEAEVDPEIGFKDLDEEQVSVNEIPELGKD